MPNRSGVWNLNTVLQAKNATNWPTRPDAPTGVSATAGNTQATVSFTAPTFQGIPATIIDYRATSTPSGITGTASGSPITVTGLANGTAYTFTVAARNELGYGAEGGPSGSVTPAVPEIGLFAGGSIFSGSRTNVINKIIITTAGNSTDFGDLTEVLDNRPGGCGSSTRGIFGGGTNSVGSNSDTINFVTFTTAGNATDFGNLTVGRRLTSAASSSTRGIFAGGVQATTPRNTIDYITIASAGNATDFGDLTNATSGTENTAGLASPTRAVFSLGSLRSNDYVTIASTGNSLDFGDQLGNIGAYAQASGSNSTRGIFAGGLWDPLEIQIQYITIASTGNALDFGDLTVARGYLQGASGTTKMTMAGGFTSVFSTYTNTIDTITIASTGNATDFGDLSVNQKAYAGTSNAHGGLS